MAPEPEPPVVVVVGVPRQVTEALAAGSPRRELPLAAAELRSVEPAAAYRPG